MNRHELTPEEQKIHARASAALDRLRSEWRRLGVPGYGARGLLTAEIMLIGLHEEKLSFEQVVLDLEECLRDCMGIEAQHQKERS